MPRDHSSGGANAVPSNGAAADDDPPQRLAAALEAFGRLRGRLSDYVAEGSIEAAAVVQRAGSWYGAASTDAREGGRGVPIPDDGGRDPALTLSPAGAPNREAERRIAALLAAAMPAQKPMHAVYDWVGTSTGAAAMALLLWPTPAVSSDDALGGRSGLPSPMSLAGHFVRLGLRHCLSSEQPGCFDAAEVLERAACQQYIQEVAKAATGRTNEALYGICCDIAGSRYEGRAGSGSIILCPEDRAANVAAVSFREPVQASQSAGARKLIEMACGRFGLLLDGDRFWGLADLDRLTHLPHIVFQGRGLWSLQGAEGPPCFVLHGSPVTRARILAEAVFKEHLRNCFPDIASSGVNRLWEMARVAARQPAGTNILFTPEAAGETARLSAQCMPIVPVQPTSEMLLQLTAVDGSAIADIEGRIHAVGAILDGPSTNHGTWQRGGRYNSAANYVSAARFPALILVVSEDGHVDIVPPIGQRRGQEWIQRRYLGLSSTAI